MVRALPYRKPSTESGTRPSYVDVYVPEEGEGSRPAVVLLHGWGEFGGTTEFTPLTALAEEIARLGATVFYFKWNTNGGWSGASGDDLACIGPFVAARSTEFGARAEDVVVVGHSMGAEAGSNLAFRSFDLPSKGDCTETGSAPIPRAFLGIGGSYGWLARPVASNPGSFLVIGGCYSDWREADASDEVAPGLTAQQAYELDGYSSVDLAPEELRATILVGSLDIDVCTNPEVSRSFAEALQTAGMQADLVEVEGADHYNVLRPREEAGKNTLKIMESILTDLEDP